jgi:hypothetical protein
MQRLLRRHAQQAELWPWPVHLQQTGTYLETRRRDDTRKGCGQQENHTLDCGIRRARLEDAEDISRVILAALRETNAKDYSEGRDRGCRAELLARRVACGLVERGEKSARA